MCPLVYKEDVNLYAQYKVYCVGPCEGDLLNLSKVEGDRIYIWRWVKWGKLACQCHMIWWCVCPRWRVELSQSFEHCTHDCVEIQVVEGTCQASKILIKRFHHTHAPRLHLDYTLFEPAQSTWRSDQFEASRQTSSVSTSISCSYLTKLPANKKQQFYDRHWRLKLTSFWSTMISSFLFYSLEMCWARPHCQAWDKGRNAANHILLSSFSHPFL